MSEETAHAEQDAPPAKVRSAALPQNAPEWINAVTGIGVLLLGIATFWNTVRISGVEDYFRSELAVRNQQIVTASDQLRGLQERSDGLRQELAETSSAVDAARRERELLGTQVTALQLRGRQLSADNDQLSEQSATLGKENAMRDFSNRLMRTVYDFIEDMRQGTGDPDTSNPGQRMLDTLERGYAANPGDSEYTRAIFASLRARCSTAADTPVVLGPYQTIAPSTSEYAQRSIPPRMFLTPAARDEWEREWAAYSAAWNERYRLHEEEQSRRSMAREEARQRAWTAIYECAADIIGASHRQF